MPPRAPSLVDLADIVADDTRTQFLAQLDTVDRQNQPLKLLTELTRPTLTVVPASKQWTRVIRGDHERTFRLDLGLWQRLDTPAQPGQLTADELIELAESIAEWWLEDKQTVTGYADPSGETVVYCTAAALQQDQPFDADLLATESVHRTVIELTFIAPS